MSISEGQERIAQWLRQMPSAPNVVWWDEAGSNYSLPRIVLQASGGAQRNDQLDGTTDADPEVTAMVETQKGDFGRTSGDIIGQIHERFRPSTRFLGMQVTRAPQPAPPLADSTLHRVPVIIRARFSF